MKKQILIVGITLLLITILFGGCTEEDGTASQVTIIWEKTFDGNGSSDWAESIAIDPNGNVYVVGFGNSLVGSSGSDIWIKKFDADGNEDTTNWNKIIGEPIHHDKATSVAIDTNENVYVVGSINDFSSPIQGWIKKFDADGNEDTTNWNKTYDGKITSVAVDNNGNVFVFGGTSLGNEYYFVDLEMYDYYKTNMWIKKFDVDGNEDIARWNITFDINRTSFGPYSIAIDNGNNVFVTFSKIIYNGSNLSKSCGIMKFDSNGNLKWNKSFEDFNFMGNSFSVDVDSNGNSYIVGYGGNLVSDSSGPDWWIKKFDEHGNEDSIKWNKTYDGNGKTDVAYAIAIDNNENVYVAGGGYNLIGSTEQDWWIKKFYSDGTQQWDVSYDGNSGVDNAYSIAVDSSENVYVTGMKDNLVGSTDLEWDWWIKKIN